MINRRSAIGENGPTMKKDFSFSSAGLLSFPFVILLGLLYHKTFMGMGRIWYNDSNYSHGFLIPVIAGYFLWERKDRLSQIEYKPSNYGIILLGLGLFAYLFGVIGGANTIMRLSFFFVIVGLVIFLFGIALFRIVSFPFLYLLFMVPLPAYLYDSIAFPLKTFISIISVACMHWLYIPAYLEGNIIHLPNITMEVADACSGIRSLYSILALSIAYAEVLKMKMSKRVVLVVSIIPVAILCNAFRVVGTGILVKYYNGAAVEGIMHEFAGIGVFGLMVASLLSIGALMKSQ
jgi:exosortase